jgi:hypothetical protein
MHVRDGVLWRWLSYGTVHHIVLWKLTYVPEMLSASSGPDETYVNFHKITWRYIATDSNLSTWHHQNPKSNLQELKLYSKHNPLRPTHNCMRSLFSNPRVCMLCRECTLWVTCGTRRKTISLDWLDQLVFIVEKRRFLCGMDWIF